MVSCLTRGDKVYLSGMGCRQLRERTVEHWDRLAAGKAKMPKGETVLADVDIPHYAPQPDPHPHGPLLDL